MISLVLWQLRADYARYPHAWRSPGFIAGLSYRLSRARLCGLLWLLPLELAAHVLRWALGASRLPAEAQIGAGLWLPHPHGITIHKRAIIGCNALIFQHVTIGQQGVNEAAVPVLSDNVTIFPGAVIAGAIGVGACAVIGANSVVTFDVPIDATVQPSPMQITQRLRTT